MSETETVANGAVPLNEAELEQIYAIGKDVWARVTEIVNADPHYAAADQFTKDASAAFLAQEALLSAIIDNCGSEANMVALAGLGRGAGTILQQAPNQASANIGFDYLVNQIQMGINDHEAVHQTKGSC